MILSLRGASLPLTKIISESEDNKTKDEARILGDFIYFMIVPNAYLLVVKITHVQLII